MNRPSDHGIQQLADLAISGANVQRTVVLALELELLFLGGVLDLRGGHGRVVGGLVAGDGVVGAPFAGLMLLGVEDRAVEI